MYVLLDEALVHFQDVEEVDACLRLVDAFPRLLVVRTFSKVYGLSGLRAGYAVGADADLLGTIAPVLGVNALTQAAVEYALRTRRRRDRSAGATPSRASAPACSRACADLPVDADASQANFVWLRAPRHARAPSWPTACAARA